MTDRAGVNLARMEIVPMNDRSNSRRRSSIMLRALSRRVVVPVLALILLLAFGGVASAQGTGPTNDELSTAINVMWMLLCGFLIFFMQAGFALVETGFT